MKYYTIYKVTNLINGKLSRAASATALKAAGSERDGDRHVSFPPFRAFACLLYVLETRTILKPDKL